MVILAGLVIVLVSIPITLYLVNHARELRSRAASVLTPPNSISATYNLFENRIDRNNDGVVDSYWIIWAPAAHTCGVNLYNLSDSAVLWTTTITNCYAMPWALTFHWRSFMGDSAPDFTAAINGSGGAADYRLVAGDGATGVLRDFSFDLSSPSIVRIHGVATINFNLPAYPGPALLVRGDGHSNDQRGHLFYFPTGSNSYVDLTATPSVVNSNLFSGYPFPGIDIPGNLYTSIYNNFNNDLYPCTVIIEWGNCSVADDANTGSFFLDKLAVGDIDGDGVDDADMTYLWKSVVYPGRPKGQSSFLGAPQYDTYYNPQNDNSGCHSGRHYGFTILGNVDSDPYLEQVDIAGLLVGSFGDPYQNVSRNIGVIDTYPHPSLPTFSRSLLWNLPENTSIPNCDAPFLYQHALHIPDTGVVKDGTGKIKLIQVNQWTQTGPSNTCTHADLPCHYSTLNSQTGSWSWLVLNASNGSTAATFPNSYVWGTVPADANSFWIIYSSQANVWNLGTISSTDATPTLRSDLKIGLFNIQTFQLTNIDPITVTAKPYVKIVSGQSFDGKLSSHTEFSKLWTVPVTGSAYPGIVLSTASGFNLFANNGIGWVKAGEYNSGGGLVAAPTVDLKINSSDNPAAIPSGTAASISWTATSTTSCTASGSWSGAKNATGSESTGNISSTQTYTLSCSGPGGNASDTVSISVFNPSVSLDSATISPKPVKADGTTLHTITLIATDGASGSNITEEYALINFQGDNTGAYRGNVFWSTTNFPYGGTPKTGYPIDCTGGGKAATFTSYGGEYINLVSCSTTVSGVTRTVVFNVKFDASFLTPATGNRISGFAQNVYGSFDDWALYDTFDLVPTTPTVTSAIIAPKPVRIDGITTQTITLTSSDAAGGAGISDNYAFINAQGSNAGIYRGVVGWSSDNFPYWTGALKTGSLISCSGGGQGAIYNGYGQEYINLVSCSTSSSGNNRITSLIVKFNTNFTTPLTGNTISSFVQNSRVGNQSWLPFDTFDLSVAQATVDIKANNSDSPSPIAYNSAATLTWTSANMTSCTASNGWLGSQILTGSISTGNLTGSKTYTITCTGSLGSASDSVTVTVNPQNVPSVKVGDLNKDGLVNIYDLSLLLSKWATTDSNADINKNGKVDIYDLSLLLSNWGK